MNDTDARDLAQWIADTWPLTSKPRVWAQALLPMDVADARRTYVRLRRDHSDRSLTIAEFTAAYRHARPAPVIETSDCPTCAGDGWVVVDYTHDGRPYRGVHPCPTCGDQRGTVNTWRQVHGRVTVAT